MSYSHYSPAELITTIVECVLTELSKELLTNVNYIWQIGSMYLHVILGTF